MKTCILRSLVVLALFTLAVPLYCQTADDLNPGADSFVNAMVFQPDGKIVVGGGFTTLGGHPRSRIARLNPDGSLDTTFNPGVSGMWCTVYCLARQGDGKILVGGVMDTLGGQARSGLGRLNSDGTVDLTFNPGVGRSSDVPYVFCLAVQADGKILVGGLFTSLGGQPRRNLGRLNSDGTPDLGFNPGAGATVSTLANQADGRIIVGGWFTTLAGAACSYIGRLNVDGTLDPGFNPGADNVVGCVVVQPDGMILLGGNFTSLGGQSRGHLARLNIDGTLDPGFDPEADDGVACLDLQADGRIVVTGGFSTLGGQPRSHLGRLNPDGTLDPNLSQGTDLSWSGIVYSAALQVDGKILVGGIFQTLAGQARARIGRLNNTDQAIQSLSCDATRITWLRGGTSPEIGRASFDASTNGTDWVNLGLGTRITGGWQLTGIVVPPNALIRALGYVPCGYCNGSGWMVETILRAPMVFSQPVSQTNGAGGVATFQVLAGGVAPLSYQWFKDGVSLEERGSASGTQTSTLTLSNLAWPDAGGYSVIISNSFGSVTSLVASLIVLDPFIVSQPLSQVANAGDTVALNVTALGTAPLDYQWRRDGTPVTGATDASLTLTNVQGVDAGCYDVVVSNGFGSLASPVALLTVNLASPDTFNPSAAGTVYTTALQSDGRILVGGAFTTLGGQARTNLGRLNADGTLDASFDPGANNTVDTLSAQSDGKLLVGGSFTSLGGQIRFHIGRLNADGTLDTGFNPGAGSPVYCLAPQADGKILVGGDFSGLGTRGATNIGRLNADGILDTNFQAAANSSVYSVAVQADGKILVGGGFTTLDGQARNHLGRVNADGSLDTTFNPGAGGPVSGLALQADGKILVGGYFLSLGGQPRNYIGRLNADGSLDSAFNPGANDFVYSLAVQADGRVQVGGNFTMLGGQSRNRLGRLNNDGTLDLTFNPGASASVYSLAQQTDGTTLVGGSFTTLGGQPREGIGRLTNADPARESLVLEGPTATWWRGGSSPEVWCANLQVSTNGSDWISLGKGARISGGWQFSGVSVPANATLRARGLATGGQYNRSSWLVETSVAVNQPFFRFSSIAWESSGGVRVQFSAAAGPIYTVEGSTDLVTWEAIGLASAQADGTFTFEDKHAERFAWRYYRIRQGTGP